eukprot:TRINITY_DN8847_c1_g2_i5.p2 TRINITY_DN8847_c1_g2~~TRINITY_DN8847_c1_g2_i5.p2  ORF type:complete len:200 (+),score=-12.94 TRINITY_DN8847_c1_g2_i5:176-775(+)
MDIHISFPINCQKCSLIQHSNVALINKSTSIILAFSQMCMFITDYNMQIHIIIQLFLTNKHIPQQPLFLFSFFQPYCLLHACLQLQFFFKFQQKFVCLLFCSTLIQNDIFKQLGPNKSFKLSITYINYRQIVQICLHYRNNVFFLGVKRGVIVKTENVRIIKMIATSIVRAKNFVRIREGADQSSKQIDFFGYRTSYIT